MQIKSVAVMLIAGCAIGMLTGCGVPQDEVDAMVAQMNAERAQAEADLNTKIADAESLLNAEKDRTRTLQNDLRDSAVLNDELKGSNKELKDSVADLNSKMSSLESQLATAKASIKSAQSQAADAENGRAAAEMQAQETQRRFDELIANLIALNKIKPEDVGWPNISVSSDMGDMGNSMGDMGMDSSGGSGSASSILDEMGNL